jgi:ornithine carbamoyltransferase
MRTDSALLNSSIKSKPPQPPIEPVAPRDLVSVHDLAPAEILSLFNLTAMLKQRPAEFRTSLSGKQMVMFFEKPSLRTRLTFEAGMDSLGGSTFFVDQTASRLNARESLYDIAHNVERWIDIIVLHWNIRARRWLTFLRCKNISAISRNCISPT